MTATLAQRLVVDRPGVYEMTGEDYHADPVVGGSLSSSGARLLLPPSCPAVFAYQLLHPRPPRREFDLGHAAHRVVLGAGEELAVVEAADWRTKAAREARDAAYAAGKVPLLAAEWRQVQDMAEQLFEHPVARALFAPGSGRPEQSLFWQDSDVWRRARLDWLPTPGGGRLVVPDYKTAASADPDRLSRVMDSNGYHQQAAWYLDAVRALDLAGGDEPAFVLVAQEKTPPYLVTVCQPDPAALRWGRALNRKAIQTYRQCNAAGRWPGYAEDVIPLPLPRWAEAQHEAAYERGELEVTW